jgi:hypothetical protein
MSEDVDYNSGLRAVRMQVALLAAGFFLLVGFETAELVRARNTLVTARAQQEQAILQGQKLRNQLRALAQGTLQLANEGDENARLIVDNLRQQGITINPPAPAAK